MRLNFLSVSAGVASFVKGLEEAGLECCSTFGRFALGWAARWTVLACLGPAAMPLLVAAADAAHAQHLEQHRELVREFDQRSARSRKAALEWARARVDKGVWLARNDPVRGDALEIVTLAHIALEQWAQAQAPATETVRIRKAARPVDQELLALALGNQAVVLFALDRGADADLVLKEQLDVWRALYAKNDLRLAVKLEQQAQYVQKGFGRTRFVVELLQQAVDIRNANAGSSPGRLAAALQELAIHEMLLSQYTDADGHLATSQTLLEREVAREPANQEVRAGLSQTFVLRAGIASFKADKTQALVFARRARDTKLQPPGLEVENALIVAQARALIHERDGDLDAAIAEQEKALDLLLGSDELFKRGQLDPGFFPGTLTSLGNLYLARGDLDLARQALIAARKQAGDTSELLLALAELERKSGHGEQALKYYREALKRRKEVAAEVDVLFGTNRLPTGPKDKGNFGGDAGPTLTLGRAVIMVPGGQYSDVTARKSRPQAAIPVGLATNPDSLVIRSKTTREPAAFRIDAQMLMTGAKLYRDTALVFVHGFNVSFDEALQRGGQLVRDLNFDGPLCVFSWPSKGSKFRYGTDRVTADRAAASLVEFLSVVQRATGAAKIHVIAHSMGNRVMLPALAAIARDPASTLRDNIGEIIFAAPAVPQAEFATWVDELGRRGLKHFTLYASAADKAMIAGYAREGLTVLAGHVTGGEPLLHPNVQSIDVSEAALGMLDMNHDVFASNPILTEDLRQLLQTGERDPARRLQTFAKRTGKAQQGVYWYYSLVTLTR